MDKQDYIAVLSGNDLDDQLIKAIEGQGYLLMRINKYEGHTTHHFSKKIKSVKDKNTNNNGATTICLRGQPIINTNVVLNTLKKEIERGDKVLFKPEGGIN